MFNFLSKLFTVKRKELEARLLPTPECTFGGVGEVEVETWSDGSISLEASLKYTGFPDGTEAEFWFGGKKVLSVLLSGGYGKEMLRSADGNAIPAVHTGDPAEIRCQNQLLYRGYFRPD